MPNKNRSAWARRRRERLRKEMGGKCVHCGTNEKLEFDCIERMGHWHHRISIFQRTLFYVRQWKERNLQLLCEACHRVKSAEEAKLDRENPF